MAFLIDFILQESPKLDSGYSWFIAICGCLYCAFNLGFYMSFGTLYVLIQERYQVSKENASYPLNVYVACSGIFGLFSGPILHRLKIRKTLVLASVVCVIGCCLSVFDPLNDPIAWLTVCMAIRGIGVSLNLPPIMQVVSTHFVKHKAKAFLIISLNVTVSGLVLPSVVRISAEEYGLESSWFIHAAIHCQTLLLVTIIRPRSVVRQPINDQLELQPRSSKGVAENDKNLVERSKNEPEIESFLEVAKIEREPVEEAVEVKSEESLRTILSFLFRDKTFYVISVFQTVLVATVIAFRTTIVDYGIDTNLESNLNKYILEIIALGDLARIPTAVFIDSGFCCTDTLVVLSTLVSALTIFLLTLTSNSVYVIVSLVYTASYGVGAASVGPMYATLGTSRLAFAFGIGLAFFGLTMLVLPSLIGLFRDRYGTYDYLYYLLTIVNVFVAILFGWARKKRWFKHDK